MFTLPPPINPKLRDNGIETTSFIGILEVIVNVVITEPLAI